jgi:hypothetical protein
MNLFRTIREAWRDRPSPHEPLPTFRVVKITAADLWQWKLFSADGTLLCVGLEPFRTERAARRGARRALAVARMAVVE